MMRDNELAGLAMTLGRDHKLTITVDGESSYCTPDGSHINIARMPATPLGRTLMTGLVFHEVGHKKFTTGAKPDGLLGDLMNVIEDVRVEKETMLERPGTRFDLEAVTNHYVAKGSLRPKDLPTALLGLVMAHGRATYLGQAAIRTQIEPCRHELRQAFGAPFVAEIETLVHRGFPTLCSTADTRSMAEEIIDLLARQTEAEEEPQGDKENPQAQEHPQERTRRGEEQGGGNAPGTEADSGEGSGAGEGPFDKDKDHAPPKDDVTLPGAGQTLRPTSEEIAQMIATGTGGFGDLTQLITAELDDLAGQAPFVCEETVPSLPRVGRHRSGAVKLDEVQCISASSRMRARLMGLLQAVRMQPESFGTSGRKLASGRMVKLALGDPRIFKKKIPVASVNTAVAILLDLSGSMAVEVTPGVSLSRADLASQAAFALHHALHGLAGVKVTAVEFSSRQPSRPEVNILVDFGQKPDSAAFHLSPDGGTPTHTALWYARSALLQRPEPRKIILVVTDGQPCESDQTRAATQRTGKDGIEVVALGIQTDAVRRYWENHRVIQNLHDLPQAMFGVMEELLVGQKGGGR